MPDESQLRDLTTPVAIDLRQVEGREWWLWGFAIAVTLGLTCGIVSLTLHGSSATENSAYYQSLRDWVRGLAALVWKVRTHASTVARAAAASGH